MFETLFGRSPQASFVIKLEFGVIVLFGAKPPSVFRVHAQIFFEYTSGVISIYRSNKL